MFCTKCGKQLPDNCAFCGQCGTPVAKAPEQPVAQPPVEEAPVVKDTPIVEDAPIVEEAPVVEDAPIVEEAPVVEAPAFAQFEAPKKVKKSKKKLIGWLSAAAAVVVAGAVAVGVFWKPLEGVWVENFGSEQDYLSYVEQNSTQQLTDTLSSAYGSVTEALTAGPANGASEMNMKLTVGERIITMLEDMLKQQTGEKMDLDWLSSIDVDMSINAKDSLQKIAMGLNIGEKELAKLDMILNMDKGEVFLAIPTLSDKYLKGELDVTAAMPNEVLDLLSDEELLKLLPSEKEMDALLDKYIGIVFDNLKDVEKTSETIKIAGVSQKLTALETEIDEEDIAAVVEALLKAAKDDKQIEKIINNAAKFMEDNDLIEDADDAYDAFKEGIEEALESVGDIEFDADVEIVLTDYVNDSHEIVGRRIEVDGQELLYYAEVRNGSKLAFELEMQGLEISGEGTEKNGAVNAEYTVIANNMELGTLTLVDFRADGDDLNGKIRIAPASDLLENLGLEAAGASAISLLDPQLELGFETGKSTSKVEINLLSGNDVLLGLAMSAKEAKATKITLPDSKDVYDSDEAEEWLQEMDVEKLLETLEDVTDLPLSDLIQGGVSQEVQRPVPGGNSSSNVSGGNASNVTGGNSSNVSGGNSQDNSRPAVKPTQTPTTAPVEKPIEPEAEPTEPVVSTFPFGTGTVISPSLPEEDWIYPTIADIEIVPSLPVTGSDIAVGTFPIVNGTVTLPDGSVITVYESATAYTK